MANIAEPQVVINYISQLKKITVNRNNQPSQLIIQTDYNLNETYNFQVINKINQIVELDVNTTYQLYGTYIDAKKQVHVLFYTLGVTPRDNMLSFLVNTYTSEYLAYVKNNRTPIDISIVAKQNVGGSTKSYMVLRDSALANPRGYIEGQAPTDIVYQNVFNSQIPVSTAFGAGNDINLVQDLDEQQIYSFAFGDTLSTNNANQFVIGYNNTPDATKAFIVANSGNIFTVDYEGNVEANSISTTSLYINGEEIGQAVDDKVDDLSTAFDDKLSATEDWVSDTFETKESATQTFNELEEDIDSISSFVSGLPTDIAAKADQTDLDEANGKIDTISGQVEYLSGAIDQHTSDIGDLNNAISAKANQTDLEALSTTVEGLAETKADLSSVYTKEEVYTYIETDVKINEATSGKADLSTVQAVDDKFANYYTSAQVDDAISTAIDEIDIPSTVYTGEDGIKVENGVISLTATLSSITNDAGFITSADIPTSYVERTELTAYATSGWVDQNYAKKGEAPTDVYTKAEVDQISSALSSAVSGAGYLTEIPTSYVQEDAISDMATQTWVGEQGYLTEVPNTYALKTDIPTDAETYEAISGDIEAQITGKNYITSDALNGLASDEDLQYVSGIVSGQAEDIDALKAVSGEVDYETVFDMLSSGDTDTLTITKDTTNQKIVLTAAGGSTGGVTPTQVSSIVEDMSGAIVDGYATENFVTSQGYVTENTTYSDGNLIAITGDANTINFTGTIPTNSDISSIASAVTTGVVTKEYVNALGIDGTTYTAGTGLGLDQTEGKHEFYLTATIPTVSTLSAGMVEATSATIRTGLATTDQIPTTVAELTDASDYALVANLPTSYISSSDVSGIVEDMSGAIRTGLATTDSISDMATQTWVGQQGYLTEVPNTYALKTDIPTDVEISGIASAVASTYIEGSTISAVSQLINDVGFVTEPRVSAIASAYAQGGGGTTYTAGSGITIDNGTIKTNLVAGSNVTFSVNDNAVTINATGGGGGGGSSDLSDYNNDVPFITAEDITNKQRVNTVNGSTITFDQAYEIFKTTYTGGDVTLNAVTVTTSQVGNGEVATFEEWITFSSAVTSLSEGTNTLVGEWPSSFDNTKTHVIVRRLYNNNGTITQYVSYAYNF